MEFSWHWNQLQGISLRTIWTKPLPQVNGSQTGTSGAGCGPMYAHSRPARASTGYALMVMRSLKRASGMGDLLEWLVDARAGLVELPAVVVAAHAALLDPAVGHVRAPVRAMAVDQPVVAAWSLYRTRSSPISRTGLAGLSSSSPAAANGVQ